MHGNEEANRKYPAINSNYGESLYGPRLEAGMGLELSFALPTWAR